MFLPYDQGHSKTVYSVVWPQTEHVLRTCFGKDLETMLARHRNPHRKTQDAYGPDFARQWWQWSNISPLSADAWSEFYPTGGASEALREIINELGGGRGSLVVFEGEYEGYEAIAAGQGIAVHKIPRQSWAPSWAALRQRLPGRVQVWMSQPSAIDGNVWDEADQVLAILGADPDVEIWWDATYTGLTTAQAHRFHPHLRPSHVAGIVMSLSKPGGMYYRRIGGCYARRPVPGLWGNRWFKNIDSLFIGQAWMQAIPAHMLPEQHQHLQRAIVQAWSDPHASPAVPWQPSDVVLLAHAPSRPATETCDRYRRGASYRVCLTPALAHVLENNHGH